MNAKKKLAYTSAEKLLAANVETALVDLAEAVDAMREHGFHESEEKNLRLLYVGAFKALDAQSVTMEAALAIIEGEHAAAITRLPAWNGYPDDAQADFRQEKTE